MRSIIKMKKEILRGRVQFPTGGDAAIRQTSPRPIFVRIWLIWYQSKTDSKVWMNEESVCTVFSIFNIVRQDRRVGWILPKIL